MGLRSFTQFADQNLCFHGSCETRSSGITGKPSYENYDKLVSISSICNPSTPTSDASSNMEK